ncbi:MAG: hypothetical protein BWY46_00123 [Firmicutes bacterium ADurb.Bin300]|nr:MAG: hypothetical protein BWY46_00123 [Firmicutes bacterium ADurb.Bin300]HOD02085.1 hypothetical protein [Clostridiales bacterium]
MIKRLALSIVAMIIFMSGCQKISINRQPAGSYLQPNDKQEQPDDSFNESKFVVSLDYIRSGASDIFIDLSIEDWNFAKSHFENTKNYFDKSKANLIEKGIPAELIKKTSLSIEKLQEALKEKNQLEASAQANQIYGFICKILSYYSRPFPAEVNTMRYYIKEVILKAEIKDIKMLVEALEPSVRLWRDLKTKLNGICEGDIIIMDSYVDSLNKAVNSKNFEIIKAIAYNILVHLEVIEMDFTNNQIK